MTPDTIASRTLWAECPKRGGFELTLQVGRPYQASDVDWGCSVSLIGLYSNLADQHGVDSWQALVLAQNLARSLLRGFVSDGGTLYFQRDGESVDPNTLFDAGI